MILRRFMLSERKSKGFALRRDQGFPIALDLRFQWLKEFRGVSRCGATRAFRSPWTFGFGD